jgi:hypothetical protein
MFDEVKALNEKRAAEQLASNRHVQNLQASQQTQTVIAQSFRALLDFLDNKVSKTEVVNHLEKIGTPDVIHVVKAIDNLHSTLKTHKNTDLSEVTAVLRAVLTETQKIPKELPKNEKQQFVDYTKQFSSLEQAIKGVQKVVANQKLVAEAPIVTIPKAEAPQVRVDAPDLRPLQTDIKAVVEAVRSIAIPEFKQDYSSLEKLLTKLDKRLKDLPDQMPRTSVSGGGGGIAAYRSLSGNVDQVVIDASGNIPVKVTNTSSTGTVTSINAAVTNATVLSANTSRKGATVYNNTAGNMYLKLGATASTSSFTIKIAAAGYYELPQPIYTGRVDALWDVSTGTGLVTELT